MGRRTDEQRRIDNTQARARRARRRGIAMLPILEVSDCHGGFGARAAFGSKPTPKELLSLSETAQHGGVSDGAACMGIRYQTVKNHLCSLYQRIGAVSVPHAMVVMGWVDIPARYRRPHP